jgi:hypothetical protein
VTTQPSYDVAPQIHLQANGGVAQWSRDLATDAGPAYGVIAGYFPATFIGIEGQYLGATNSTSLANTVLFDHVTTNGLLGDVRVGVPFVVEPFVFGGLGWMHFNVTGPATSRTDDSLVFPVGGGLEAHLGSSWLIGARFTYNFVNSGVANKANSDLWTATANIGTSIQ